MKEKGKQKTQSHKKRITLLCTTLCLLVAAAVFCLWGDNAGQAAESSVTVCLKGNTAAVVLEGGGYYEISDTVGLKKIENTSEEALASRKAPYLSYRVEGGTGVLEIKNGSTTDTFTLEGKDAENPVIKVVGMDLKIIDQNSKELKITGAGDLIQMVGGTNHSVTIETKGSVTLEQTGTETKSVVGNGNLIINAQKELGGTNMEEKERSVKITTEGKATGVPAIGGNLTIVANMNVEITARGTGPAVTGNLEITMEAEDYQGNDHDKVTVKAPCGSLTGGNLAITANQNVTLEAEGDASVPAIQGGATIDALVLKITSKNTTAIGGNATLKTKGILEVTGGGDSNTPVIGGSSVTINSADAMPVITRKKTNGDPGNTGFLAEDVTLSSENEYIKFIGMQSSEEPAEKGYLLDVAKNEKTPIDTTLSDGCKHPLIVEGSNSVKCVACGKEGVSFAEICTKDGEAIGDVSSTKFQNTLLMISIGMSNYAAYKDETTLCVKFTKKCYFPNKSMDFGNTHRIILDPNEQELALGSLENSIADEQDEIALTITGNGSIDIKNAVRVQSGSLMIKNQTCTVGAITANTDVTLSEGVTCKGGIEATAGDVTIGAGATCGGDITATKGTVKLGAGATCGGKITVGNGLVITATNVTCKGGIEATAGDVTIGAGATCGGDITATKGTVELAAGATCGGDITAGNDVTIKDNATCTGTVTATNGDVTVTNSKCGGITAGNDVTVTNSKCGGITVGNALKITGGTINGAIENNSTVKWNETATDSTLVIEDTIAELSQLTWKPARVVQVTDSHIKISGNCWVEGLTMDKDSVIEIGGILTNAVKISYSSGGTQAPKTPFDDIQQYLPSGYSIVNIQKGNSGEQHYTVWNENSNVAKNFKLCDQTAPKPAPSGGGTTTNTGSSVLITAAEITFAEKSFAYTGKPQEPKLVVNYAGNTLTEGRHYRCTYKNNINAGTASVMIEGTGNFRGSQTLQFTIQKAERTAPEGLTVKAVSAAGKKNGAIGNLTNEMEYSKNQTNWIRVSAKDKETVKWTGLSTGKYYVRYAENENYLASPAVTLKLTVAKKKTKTGQLPAMAAWKGGKLLVKWEKVKKADGYEIYVVSYGDETALKDAAPVKTTDAGTLSVKLKKLGKKKLSRKDNYQIVVRAFQLVKGKKVYLAESESCILAGKTNNKYTNPKKIRLAKKAYTLTVGDTAKLRAKLVKQDPDKKLLPGAALRYTTTDSSIAAVTADGTLRAKKAGICLIGLTAPSGITATVKITVKP